MARRCDAIFIDKRNHFHCEYALGHEGKHRYSQKDDAYEWDEKWTPKKLPKPTDEVSK